MEKIYNIIEDFNPISLKELEKSALLNRADTKFVISLPQLETLLPQLSSHYDILEVKGKRANHYKTLYFDTLNNDFYLQHHNGKNGRYKVRIRSYVDSNLYFLEVKYKFKERTIKSRLPLTDFENEFSDTSLAFLKNIMKTDFQVLKPTLWNDFHRITLSNKNVEERLTIDLNLNFEWQSEKKDLKNYVVVELKQPRINLQSPFYQKIKEMGIRPMSMSKYCFGLIFIKTALGEKIKSNTFKPRLLKLKKLDHARVD